MVTQVTIAFNLQVDNYCTLKAMVKNITKNLIPFDYRTKKKLRQSLKTLTEPSFSSLIILDALPSILPPSI